MIEVTSLSACSPRHRFWRLVRKLGVGVLTTRSDKGMLTSRQVSVCNGRKDAGPVLRLMVAADTLWLRDIALDPHVSLAYVDSLQHHFLSISGSACLRGSAVAQPVQRVLPGSGHAAHGSWFCASCVVEVQVVSALLKDEVGQLAISANDLAEKVHPKAHITPLAQTA